MRCLHVAMIGLLAAPAQAATWYVEPGDTLAAAVRSASTGDEVRIDPTWLPNEPPVLVDKDLLFGTDTPGTYARLPSLLVDGVEVQLDQVHLVGALLGVDQTEGISTVLADTCRAPDTIATGGPGLCVVGGTVIGEDLVAGGLSSYTLRAGAGSWVDLTEFTIAGAPMAPAAYLSEGAKVKLTGGSVSAAVRGGFWVVESDLHLHDVVLYDNSPGALSADGVQLAGSDLWLLSSTAELTDCDLTSTGGWTGLVGGSIYSSDSHVVLRQNTFYGQQATRGGVIAVEGGSLEVHDTSFENNRASEGGGVGWLEGASLVVEDSSSRDARADQGGVWWVKNGSVVSRRNTWWEHQASTAGGALYLVEETSLLSEGDLYRTTTSYPSSGGGIYAEGGDIALRSFRQGSDYVAATMDGHRAAREGGFLYLKEGSLAIEDVDAWNNEAEQGGGFAWLESTDSAWVHDSRFQSHAAGLDAGSTGSGGVLGTRDVQDLAIKRCSFCNSAANQEGAVVLLQDWAGGRFEFYWNQVHYSVSYTGASISTGTLASASSSPGRAEIVNNTFTQDWSGVSAVGLDLDEVWLVDNIFAWQDGTTAAAWTAVSTSLDAGYNLYWEVDPLALGSAASVIPSTGAVLADPSFVSFSRDDAPVCEQDWHLRSGSPAVDAGDPNLHDEDGSRADMGAYGGRGIEAVDTGDPPDTGELGVDEDGDGWSTPEDCDDTRAQVYPGAPDAPDDGIDSDCDGSDTRTTLVAGGGCATARGLAIPALALLLAWAFVVGCSRPREESP